MNSVCVFSMSLFMLKAFFSHWLVLNYFNMLLVEDKYENNMYQKYSHVAGGQ
jgi:hypothetical protein